jgi:hypothetical protein
MINTFYNLNELELGLQKDLYLTWMSDQLTSCNSRLKSMVKEDGNKEKLRVACRTLQRELAVFVRKQS